jgi:hypothetical protein
MANDKPADDSSCSPTPVTGEAIVLAGMARDSIIESTIAESLHDVTVNLSIRTAARVKAAIDAYIRVYTNFAEYIIRQSEALQQGNFGEKEVFKEVSVARLVAQWLTETEEFIDTNEPMLQQSSHTIRQSYIESTMAALPDDLRMEIMGKLAERRMEMAEWLTQEIQRATMIADRRRMGG